MRNISPLPALFGDSGLVQVSHPYGIETETTLDSLYYVKKTRIPRVWMHTQQSKLMQGDVEHPKIASYPKQRKRRKTSSRWRAQMQLLRLGSVVSSTISEEVTSLIMRHFIRSRGVWMDGMAGTEYLLQNVVWP